MNIDESVTFFQEFLTALYEQDVAALMESDEELDQRVARTESFIYAPPGTTLLSPFNRPKGNTLEELAEIAAKSDTPQRRPLFLVVQYDVPGLGTCFAGYAGGSDELTSLTYERQYWAMEVAGKPRIISLYTIDYYANESRLGWENTGGAIIGNTGDPVTTRGLQEPFLDLHLQDYHRILELAQGT